MRVINLISQKVDAKTALLIELIHFAGILPTFANRRVTNAEDLVELLKVVLDLKFGLLFGCGIQLVENSDVWG